MLGIEKFSTKALSIIKSLNDRGFQSFFVGGCIRDLLLGITPHEWDITTDATPEEILATFKRGIPTGIKFGTITVLEDSEPFEVTTFRKDENYIDGRHPENVRFTKDINEDLARRDFTINAIAYNPYSKTLIDLFDGKKDLENKIIRAVGNPLERFREDGLRAVRACRFAPQLGFTIEDETFKAISKTLDVVKKVAIERVHDELVKLLKSNIPSIGFEYMRISGLLDLFLPELSALYGVEQPKQFHKHDVYWHSLYSCDSAPKNMPTVRLAALFHDIAKPKCKDGETFYNHDKEGEILVRDILKRLRFGNATIETVSNLVSHHMFNYTDEWKDPAVRRFIRRVGKENIASLFDLRKADTSSMGREVSTDYLQKLQKRIDKILREKNALHISDLKVSGNDIMELLQIPPSKKVGKILETLLDRVIEDPSLNEREILLNMAKEL